MLSGIKLALATSIMAGLACATNASAQPLQGNAHGGAAVQAVAHAGGKHKGKHRKAHKVHKAAHRRHANKK